jgi:hypothetical protein
MINFNSTSGFLILISLLAFCALFFIGFAIPDQYAIIRFGYDTSFLVLIIGYILRKKNIQQIIGLFVYLIVYNFDILQGDLFQIQNNNLLYFIRYYTFFIIVISFLLLFPTTFDKYKFTPMTNRANIKDSTIIFTSIVITILFQIIIRFIV